MLMSPTLLFTLRLGIGCKWFCSRKNLNKIREGACQCTTKAYKLSMNHSEIVWLSFKKSVCRTGRLLPVLFSLYVSLMFRGLGRAASICHASLPFHSWRIHIQLVGLDHVWAKKVKCFIWKFLWQLTYCCLFPSRFFQCFWDCRWCFHALCLRNQSLPGVFHTCSVFSSARGRHALLFFSVSTSVFFKTDDSFRKTHMNAIRSE